MGLFTPRNKLVMPAPEEAPPGRDEPIRTAKRHHVSSTPLKGPYPPGIKTVIFGMGCFWGAERLFWQMPGVYVTAVGYADGYTPNPTYEEVCSGMTGHNEVVLVAYDPDKISLEELLGVFWESHDPTQVMRQGNDVGTQYRSAVYYTRPDQKGPIVASRDAYAKALKAKGAGEITTDIKPAPEFFFAEDYHQQYLAKNPRGYCSIRGTGVAFPADKL